MTVHSLVKVVKLIIYSLMPALHFEKLPESSRHGDAWQGIDAPIVPLSLSIEAYSFVTDYDLFIRYFLSVAQK